MIKKAAVIFACIVCSGCPIDSDEEETYACDITSSSALFASDRKIDIDQCWNTKQESLSEANKWCQSRVTSYIDDRYVFGHDVQYIVRKGKC